MNPLARRPWETNVVQWIDRLITQQRMPPTILAIVDDRPVRYAPCDLLRVVEDEVLAMPKLALLNATPDEYADATKPGSTWCGDGFHGVVRQAELRGKAS